MDRHIDAQLRAQLRASGAVMPGELAERAFARATGAELVGGNAVRILRDAAEHFPAWLEAIRAAEDTILLESYIIAAAMM